MLKSSTLKVNVCALPYRLMHEWIGELCQDGEKVVVVPSGPFQFAPH